MRSGGPQIRVAGPTEVVVAGVRPLPVRPADGAGAREVSRQTFARMEKGKNEQRFEQD